VNNFEHHLFYQGIPCLHDEIVMELMWGMKRLMRSLVRREKSELPKEDSVPMSKGLQMLLSRYGFDIEPEMVSLPAVPCICFIPCH
jgi:nucleolar protein 58